MLLSQALATADFSAGGPFRRKPASDFRINLYLERECAGIFSDTSLTNCNFHSKWGFPVLLSNLDLGIDIQPLSLSPSVISFRYKTNLGGENTDFEVTKTQVQKSVSLLLTCVILGSLLGLSELHFIHQETRISVS